MAFFNIIYSTFCKSSQLQPITEANMPFICIELSQTHGKMNSWISPNNPSPLLFTHILSDSSRKISLSVSFNFIHVSTITLQRLLNDCKIVLVSFTCQTDLSPLYYIVIIISTIWEVYNSYHISKHH